jgi:hypothetical protein
MSSTQVATAEDLTQKRDWFAAQGHRDVRIKVFGAEDNKAQLEVMRARWSGRCCCRSVITRIGSAKHLDMLQ